MELLKRAKFSRHITQPRNPTAAIHCPQTVRKHTHAAQAAHACACMHHPYHPRPRGRHSANNAQLEPQPCAQPALCAAHTPHTACAPCGGAAQTTRNLALQPCTRLALCAAQMSVPVPVLHAMPRPRTAPKNIPIYMGLGLLLLLLLLSAGGKPNGCLKRKGGHGKRQVGHLNVSSRTHLCAPTPTWCAGLKNRCVLVGTRH